MSRRMTKPTKWSVRTAKTQISLGIHPVWSVFAVRMKKRWALNYLLSAQWRLIRLGGCPGWSESSLGAHVILLVLSCGGSYLSMHITCLESWARSTSWENLFLPYANNKGAYQPSHLRLIQNFKRLARPYSWAGRLLSKLLANLEDRFYHDVMPL